MISKEKVSELLLTLLDSEMLDDLLEIHKEERKDQIASIVNALFTTSIILSIITFFVLFFIDASLILTGIVYWTIASMLIFSSYIGFDYLIDNGILCRKPIIEMLITPNPNDLITGKKYRSYSKEDVSNEILVNVLIQSIPVLEKTPFHIAIKYLGIKNIYKFDGNILTDDAYNKIINGEEISINTIDDINNLIKETDIFDNNERKL